MKKLLYLFIILAIGFAGFFGVKTYQKMAKANTPIEINGSYFDSPRLISPFALKKTSGLNFDDTDLMNHWTLIFFGYTRCPDICPTTLKTLNEVYTNLKKDVKLKDKDIPDVVFISVDTNRDDIEQLKDFLSRFNKDFIGVGGSKEQLNTLSRNLGVIYNKLAVGKDQENYLYDHSSTIYAINPRGELQAIFSAPHKSTELSAQYKIIIDRYNLLS